MQSDSRTGQRNANRNPRNGVARRGSQQWRPRGAEGQPGSRGESGAGRRMIWTPGCEPLGASSRVAGEAEPGNRGSRAGGRSTGSGAWATGGHGECEGFTAEEGTGQPGRQSAKADRPPKRKLRRAMTLVETEANARRSIGGGSPSDPGVAPGGAQASASSATRGASLFPPMSPRPGSRLGRSLCPQLGRPRSRRSDLWLPGWTPLLDATGLPSAR